MRRTAPLVALLVAGCATPAAVDEVASTPADPAATEPAVEAFHPDTGWELVWSDEFDGAELDTTKWGYEENCWGGGNDEQQCYTSRTDNVRVEDGLLHLVAREESFTGIDGHEDWTDVEHGQKTLPYTSGRIRTKGKADWTYGRFEIRAKLPEGQGMWPAIWMLPTDSPYGGWAAGGEIDIVEAVNLRTVDGANTRHIHGTLHYGAEWPGNVFSGQSWPLHRDQHPADVFRVYALEWEQGAMRWFVDDIHYATQTSDGWYTEYVGPDGELVVGDGDAPFDQPFHLLMNVAVGGNWPGPPNADTTFPQQMLVDYVRVYRCGASPADGVGCGTSSPDAIAVEGVAPAERLFSGAFDGTFDPDTLGDEFVVFDDDRVFPWDLDVYTASGGVDLELVEDPERGDVVQATFDTNEAVVFFQAGETYDLSAWADGNVEFDLRVLEFGASSNWMMKVDCEYPCGTGDVPIGKPVVGEWTSYSIPVADLLDRPGSTLDLGKVDTPLVIFPAWGSQRGAVMQIDDVRWTR